jgi:hypothetical protein
VPGPAWTSPLDRSRSQVPRTESPNGRGRSPARAIRQASGPKVCSTASSQPGPADPGAERAYGRLAALTADAYAAVSSYSLLSREDLRCAAVGCPREPMSFFGARIR